MTTLCHGLPLKIPLKYIQIKPGMLIKVAVKDPSIYKEGVVGNSVAIYVHPVFGWRRSFIAPGKLPDRTRTKWAVDGVLFLVVDVWQQALDDDTDVVVKLIDPVDGQAYYKNLAHGEFISYIESFNRCFVLVPS